MYAVYSDGELVYSPDVSNMDGDNFSATGLSLQLEVGKAGSLTFTLPHTNTMWDKIRKMLSVITVLHDTEEIFRGRVLDIDEDFYKNRAFYCEGDLSYLNDGVKRPYTWNDTTVKTAFTSYIDEYNKQVDASRRFVVGNVSVSNNTNHVFTNDRYNNMYSEIFSCLPEIYGGYLKTRQGTDGKRYIDYLQEPGVKSSQAIEFGVNIADLSKHISAENVITVLIPVGKDGLTINSINANVDYLIDENAVKLFGKIWGFVNFDEIENEHTLKNMGMDYLKQVVEEALEIELDAVDLSNINVSYDKIIVGNMYRVVSAPHNIDKYFMCAKADIDLADPAQNKYTFTNPPSSMAKKLQTTSDGITMAVSGVGSLKESSDEARSLAQHVQEQEAARLYESLVTTDNGILFKDHESETTLEANIFDGSENITDQFIEDGGSIVWKDGAGTVVGTGKTLTVDSSEFSTQKPTDVYTFEAVNSDDILKAKNQDTVGLALDGAAGPEAVVTVYIASYDAQTKTATLSAVLRINGTIVTPSSYTWTKNADTTVIGTTSSISVTDLGAVYNCKVTWQES